jgi:predicted secreted hydrolase
MNNVTLDIATKGVAPLLNPEEDLMWKQKYPTHWVVELPEFDTHLQVTSSPKEQEIVSEFINKYEAASKVSGTFMGATAEGFCYIELVGDYTK